MAAGLQSPIAIRQWLVRLGHLSFDDFLLLNPQTLDFGLRTSDLAPDWSLALNNIPHVLLHFRRSDPDLASGLCALASDFVPSLEEIRAAQSRLVHAFAYDLLKAKAPPLHDALPWHDWDFSIVTRRFRLWKTRFLLAGDGTTVTVCRCRKSAGVYVVEPDVTIARYVERKAEMEKVRRFRLVSPRPQAANRKLSQIPLPDNSVDLAVIGSAPDLQTANCQLVIQELLRVAANVLLVENSPLAPPLAEAPMTDAGFRPDTVDVGGLGQRRCWWKQA